MTTIDGTGLDVAAPLVSILRCRLCGVEAQQFDLAPARMIWHFANAGMKPDHPFGVARHACGDWRLGVLEEAGFLYGMPDDLDALVWVSVGPEFSDVGVAVPLRDVWPIGAGGEGCRTLEVYVHVDDSGVGEFATAVDRIAAECAAVVAAYERVLAADSAIRIEVKP